MDPHADHLQAQPKNILDIVTGQWFESWLKIHVQSSWCKAQINNPLMRKWGCGRPPLYLTAGISNRELQQHQPDVCPPESGVQYSRTDLKWLRWCNNDIGVLDKVKQPAVLPFHRCWHMSIKVRSMFDNVLINILL